MSSIPLPALQVKPPEQSNLLEQYRAMQQIKSGQQQQQIQQLAIQKAQQQQKDSLTVRDSFSKNKGDIDKTLQEVAGKVGADTYTALQQHAVDVKQKMSTLTADQLKNIATQNDNARGLIQPVIDAPAEKQAEMYAQSRAAALQNPQAYGITDPSQIPEQFPGADALKQQIAIHQGGKQQAEQAFKEREVSAQEMTAQGRKAQGDAALAKSAPLNVPTIQMMNKQLQNRYQVLNPGQQLPQEYTVPTGANRQNFEDISSSLEKLETAASARANRAQTQATQGGARADARADKSYQFNSGQLEKVAAPVDQAIGRMSRLQDALAQNTPQADALIAPELLSVMAGGAGSGLRMNEAEIARIVGGRSKWETLKSSINQWNTDPSKATTITDEQRSEIRSLVSEVDKKLKAKQSALDEARQGLINSDDPTEHKKLVVNARTKMTQIDQGGNQEAPVGMIKVQIPGHPPGTIPAGARAQFLKDHPDAQVF